MGVVNVSCQLAPTQTLKKGVKTFWVQSVADRFESVNHINGVSLNLLLRPLDQAPSFRFPNCMRLEKEPTTKGTCTVQPMVVYHLFRRTGRFTVWANSEHFKFSPGIAFAICTNQFHSSKKWPRRPETRIKDGFEENGTRISVWNIPSGKKKRGLPSLGVPLLS